MTKRREEIQAHWNAVGKEWGQDPQGAMPDPHLRKLEFNTACKFIDANDSVLDLGCGNGAFTIEIARRTAGAIVGVDYASEMINAAKESLKKQPSDIRKRVSFINEDVVTFNTKEKFSKIFTFRCLINISAQDKIATLFEKIARWLLPGGQALLSESTIQGFEALNKARASLDMPPIRIRWHNTPVDEDLIFDLCQRNGLILEDIIDYSSFYYLISRCVNIKFAELIEYEKDFFEELDDIAVKLPSVGRYGPLRMFNIIKK